MTLEFGIVLEVECSTDFDGGFSQAADPGGQAHSGKHLRLLNPGQGSQIGVCPGMWSSVPELDPRRQPYQIIGF